MKSCTEIINTLNNLL